MEYIIGIDSGGTKSELVAYNLNCNEIYRCVGRFGNPEVDLETSLNNIGGIIERCIDDLREHVCVFIAVGIAGVETGNLKNIIEEHLKNKFSVDTLILNDAEMSAKAYFGDGDGIVAIAGTGSSVYIQRNRRGRLVGGWGHIIGDEGSGYHTVIEAFKRIAYKMDNNIPLDELSLELLKRMEASTPGDIKGFVHGNYKDTIASLFPAIVMMSDKGDDAAQRLLKDAGMYLAKTAIAACSEFNRDEHIIIALKGGLFYNSRVLLESYENEIKKEIKYYSFNKSDVHTARAVCNIYRAKK